jgi:hypothetical protein
MSPLLKLGLSIVIHLVIATAIALAFKLELHEVVAFIALYGALTNHINYATMLEALSEATKREG